jgi:mannose-1-phosphate guanylyltransferase
MFIWRAGVFAEKLRRYAPEYFPFWERMLEALDKRRQKDLVRTFEEIPIISIDYALMEKARGVWVAKGDFRWSDVGAWSSLYEVWARDGDGNASRGESFFLASKDCLVYNPKKITALVGVRDLIVVDAGDALLICHRNEDQKVKDIVEALKKKRPEYV